MGAGLWLLDRDGVINQDVGSPGVTTVDAFRLIPGAARSIARLKLAGASVCVVTNQTCVGKGLVTEEGLAAIHNRMRELLVDEGGAEAVVDDIFVATKTTDTPCDRRKPAPGMMIEAMRLYGCYGDEGRCGRVVTMVGDSVTDMQAAAAAGVANRVMVATGHGAEIMRSLVLAREGGGVYEQTVRSRGGTPMFVATPEDDPRGTLPPETLPLVMYADIEEAVDDMLR